MAQHAPPRLSTSARRQSLTIAATRETVTATFQRKLAALRFPEEVDLDVQSDLEKTYVDWARSTLEGRERALSRTHTRTAAFQAALSKGWIAMWGSALRAPVRGALTTEVNPGSNLPGELGTGADALVAGGALASLTSFLQEHILQKALERVARQDNVASRKAVPPDILEPTPCEVQLHVFTRAGVKYKRYYRPATRGSAAQFAEGLAGIKTMPQLLDETRRRQDAHKLVQGLLEGHALGTSRPLLSGMLQVGRRLASSREQLQSPWLVLVESIAASGSAAFLDEFAFTSAMALKHTEVDDLAGGKLSLPLFTAEHARPEADLPSWKHLLWSARGEELRHVIQAAGEFADASRHQPVAVLRDLFLRHLPANVLSAYAGLGDGVILGSIAAPAGRLDQTPGESPQSARNLLLQFANTAMGVWTWDMFRHKFAALAVDIKRMAQARRDMAAVQAQGSGTSA